MRNRGIYSMVSAFFLTIVLVFIALGLVYLNLFVLSHENQVFEGTKPFELASDVKTKIIDATYCFNGRITEEKMLENDLFEECGNKMVEFSQSQATGFSIERMQHLDCLQLENSFGDMQQCSHRFVFFVNIEKNYKKCLGKMVICMNAKKAGNEPETGE